MIGERVFKEKQMTGVVCGYVADATAFAESCQGNISDSSSATQMYD